MNFDLSKYATVDSRIADFYAQHPEGSIRTRLAIRDGDEVIFEARIYRTREDVASGVYCCGWAREIEGKSPVNRTSHLENAETSAIGRALANLGFSGHVNGKAAPRPSREEMEKAGRPPPLPKQERYAARIRELAAEVDALREQKKVDLTKRSAVSDAEDFLAAPDCNVAIMEKHGNKLGAERDRLASLPDPGPGYTDFQVPPMEEAGEGLPFD